MINEERKQEILNVFNTGLPNEKAINSALDEIKSMAENKTDLPLALSVISELCTNMLNEDERPTYNSMDTLGALRVADELHKNDIIGTDCFKDLMDKAEKGVEGFRGHGPLFLREFIEKTRERIDFQVNSNEMVQKPVINVQKKDAGYNP